MAMILEKLVFNIAVVEYTNRDIFSWERERGGGGLQTVNEAPSLYSNVSGSAEAVIEKTFFGKQAPHQPNNY